MSGWTKGPWATAGTINPRYIASIGDATLVRRQGEQDDRYVALAVLDGMANGVATSDAEREANARLIAAAPDLAEALEYMADLFKDLAGDPSTDDGWKTEEMRDVYFAAVDALALAAGTPKDGGSS